MRVLAFLAVVVFAQGRQAPARIEIVTIGEHHGDEVPANTPGSWFALLPDATGASVQRVNVTVATITDAVVDEGEERTGKRVDVVPPVEPIVLVRGIRGLEAGRVPTVFVNRPIVGPETLTRLGRRSYLFSLQCQERPSIEGQHQERCRLTLRSGPDAQVLFDYLAYYEGDERVWGSENVPTILWAGDLNGDDRLDVLLETSNHYNVDEMRLYLSNARSGTVSEVAVHTTTGC